MIWATSPVHHCHLEPASLQLHLACLVYLSITPRDVRNIPFSQTHARTVVLDADLLLVCCQRKQHNGLCCWIACKQILVEEWPLPGPLPCVNRLWQLCMGPSTHKWGSLICSINKTYNYHYALYFFLWLTKMNHKIHRTKQNWLCQWQLRIGREIGTSPTCQIVRQIHHPNK